MRKEMSNWGGVFLTNKLVKNENSIINRKVSTGKSSINDTSFCCIF